MVRYVFQIVFHRAIDNDAGAIIDRQRLDSNVAIHNHSDAI